MENINMHMYVSISIAFTLNLFYRLISHTVHSYSNPVIDSWEYIQSLVIGRHILLFISFFNMIHCRHTACIPNKLSA